MNQISSISCHEGVGGVLLPLLLLLLLVVVVVVVGGGGGGGGGGLILSPATRIVGVLAGRCHPFHHSRTKQDLQKRGASIDAERTCEPCCLNRLRTANAGKLKQTLCVVSIIHAPLPKRGQARTVEHQQMQC